MHRARLGDVYCCWPSAAIDAPECNNVRLLSRTKVDDLLIPCRRRIDLLSKLLAPLFVSLLTTTAGYSTSCIVLLAISASTTFFELIFIGVVFRRFAVLGEEEARARESREQITVTTAASQAADPAHSDATHTYPPGQQAPEQLTMFGTTFVYVQLLYQDWKTFTAMPIFTSSITIALLYMSVLSFDSTFIAYLKSETTYSDAFIAGMRGVCVVAGLVGTFVSPFLTKRIGLVRTGSWSLWLELIPLTPVVISFYLGALQMDRPAWNTAMLFGGMALSRIGLWSFDLAQLAQVQSALATHPRRNALMALQFSLQNLLDLGHYALTLGWSRPAQFRNAVDVSYAFIGAATLLYVFAYARRERGHVFHLEKLGAVGLWKKNR
jgi:iron-regulated transporter 1